VAQHDPRWQRVELPTPRAGQQCAQPRDIIAPTTMPNRNYMPADPVTQYGELS